MAVAVSGLCAPVTKEADMTLRVFPTIHVAVLLAGAICMASASVAPAQPKDAEPATRQMHAEVLRSLPFGDRADFEDAQRGFIAPGPDDIKSADGQRTIWSMQRYAFVTGEAPPTVNPSLWRQAQLNNFNGLFKVIDRVYQIRGLDDSNMMIVEADTGLIVVDTLSAAESAKAAMDLYYQHRPRKPVVAVIYTHSHVDHFGGVKGVLGEDNVRAGQVKIVAPDRFMEHAVAETIVVGTAMFRRSLYQFGPVLPTGERGQVDAGHGKNIPRGGTFTLIAPTDLIKENYEVRTIDGIDIEFHLVPGSEAPAEMTLYFPQFRILNMAEDTNHTMHNLYALRGAEVRDARLWASYINESLDRYGDRTDVLIAQHQWPTWGGEKIAPFLKKQRDLYKFIHDQSVRLINRAYTPNDIAATLKMPASLANDWSARGYYGTLSHNAKAVYQKYLGWYDANPANLSPLPPVEQARKTIEYMGGAGAVITRAHADFNAGHYRWVASVMNQVIFADPTNKQARELGADALEQLGYQAEAATWRNAYLMGAMELRNGVTRLPPGALAHDMIKAVPIDGIFDLWAVRLNPDKAEGKAMVLNWTFTDVGEKFTLNLENSALTHLRGKLAAKADAGFTLTRATLDTILFRQTTFTNAIQAGAIKVDGEPGKLGEFLAMLDEIPADVPIVEPVQARP
jgi:alkyl sulfatase BDS1-like metallo-beta-lactamase superfamily hydrolase